MTKPYSMDLRERVVSAVDAEGMSRHEAAARFGIAVSTGLDPQSLIWHIRFVFDEAATEREELIARRRDLDAEVKRVKRRENEFTPEKFKERLAEIKRDKGEINHAIRQGIDDVAVLRFLTDKGVLPNYAFPEEGVKLKSIIARQPEDGRREENGENLVTREYVRPASSALSEFGPGRVSRVEAGPHGFTQLYRR
jgi:DEAD/DEAH box helicase domain-containing protein